MEKMDEILQRAIDIKELKSRENIMKISANTRQLNWVLGLICWFCI
jgi:hypothetical protein